MSPRTIGERTGPDSTETKVRFTPTLRAGGKLCPSRSPIQGLHWRAAAGTATTKPHDETTSTDLEFTSTNPDQIDQSRVGDCVGEVAGIHLWCRSRKAPRTPALLGVPPSPYHRRSPESEGLK